MTRLTLLSWLISWQGVVDLIWLVFLLAVFIHFWKRRQFLSQASDWLITSARMTQFQWTREGHQLWAKIEYTYQLYDREFVGEYFFLDTSHNNPNSKYARQVAYRAAMAFENDAEIEVYYNPDNPNQSALDVRIPFKLNLIIGLCLFLIVLHLLMIVRHFV